MVTILGGGSCCCPPFSLVVVDSSNTATADGLGGQLSTRCFSCSSCNGSSSLMESLVIKLSCGDDDDDDDPLSCGGALDCCFSLSCSSVDPSKMMSLNA